MKNKSMLMGCISLVGSLLHGEVLIDENFDTLQGMPPVCQRATQANVVAGQGAIGSDPAVHFFDESSSESGVLEYNAGVMPAGAFSITFDLLNNAPFSTSDNSGSLVFSAGKWVDGRSYALKSSDTRAFALMFSQVGMARTLAIRVGKSTVEKGTYDLQALQHIKVLVNDHDSQPLAYSPGHKTSRRAGS